MTQLASSTFTPFETLAYGNLAVPQLVISNGFLMKRLLKLLRIEKNK
jgi:hypothetical protein